MSNSPNIPSANQNEPNESLPRALILSHRGWVKKMFDSGRRHHHRLLSLIELSKPQSYGEQGKVAFFTPKKIGKAHDRNRVRRQMKEIYRRRLQKTQTNQLWIWLAKPAASKSSFATINSAMQQLAQKATFKAESKTESTNRPPSNP